MKRGDIKQNRVMASKPSINKTFKELGEEFLRHSEVKGLSEWTIKSYRHHTNYFLEFIGEGTMCKDINLSLIEDYIVFLKQNKGLTNAVTINSYIRNISPIIKYGIKMRYILNDFQIPLVRGQETFKDIYTAEELRLLLSTPDNKDFTSLRTYTIIWVLASTGIRARELRELSSCWEYV